MKKLRNLLALFIMARGLLDGIKARAEQLGKRKTYAVSSRRGTNYRVTTTGTVEVIRADQLEMRTVDQLRLRLFRPLPYRRQCVMPLTMFQAEPGQRRPTDTQSGR